MSPQFKRIVCLKSTQMHRFIYHADVIHSTVLSECVNVFCHGDNHSLAERAGPGKLGDVETWDLE